MSEKAPKTRFIVMPFKMSGGKNSRLVSVENREARDAETAVRLAENMSVRFAGVAAYQMDIDEETGEMSNGMLLAHHGKIVNILEDA